MQKYERQLRWRIKHRDRYNKYMRDYMRKRKLASMGPDDLSDL